MKKLIALTILSLPFLFPSKIAAGNIIKRSSLLNDIALSEYDREQIRCLAANIFYEARSEPIDGQEMVALVTLNRVKNKNHPDTVCKVVTKYAKVRGKKICQFSWYCEKGKAEKLHSRYLRKKNPENYEEVYILAKRVYTGYSFLPKYKNLKNVLFYHADYVTPNWDFSKIKKIAKEGKHIFYEPKRKYS